MDAELVELQRQFEFAQQVKSSTRLSERNVVELIQKLHQLQIIDYDLLHTVNGKEYITPGRLRDEILSEVERSGRVSLIDLADSIGVDLFYIEKQAEVIVKEDEELGVSLIQGELITRTYWDGIGEEINERLQECSQISLAEIAGSLHIGSELLVHVLEPRLGTIVKGRLEGGQIYTPAYVARVSAMVRGATRGLTVPTNLTTVWSSLQQVLQETDGSNGVAVDGAFFQSLFNGLVKEGEILGSVRAGVYWTPAVFGHAQRESVESFFSQNSYINYEVLQKLAIPQPKHYLQSRYPDGIALDTVFVHPSIVEMLDAAAEDVIKHGGWIDSLSVVPAIFGYRDASKLLSLCPSVRQALKVTKAVIMGESYLLNSEFVKDVFERMKDLDISSLSSSTSQGLYSNMNAKDEVKGGYNADRLTGSNEVADDSSGSKHSVEKGSKKKRGKATGVSTKTGKVESNSDDYENLPVKAKKNQKKGKDSGSLQVSDPKNSDKKGSDKLKEECLNVSEEWIMEKILMLVPDFEGQGLDDLHTLLQPLAVYLRPMLLTAWKDKRNSMFTENAERIKCLLDNLQKKIDEAFLNMQLYEKALDLFDDEPSTSVILHKHLLKTTATSIADTLLTNLDIYNRLNNGVDVEESQNLEFSSLSSGDRISLAKKFSGALSVKAVAMVEALEGKRVEMFMNTLRTIAEESGLLLKKLDKKLERTLLHSYRKDLISQVSTETDPVALLPKVVSLLYLQVYNKALQAPGRAIHVSIARLKDKLEGPAYKILNDYHAATVTLLALLSAATDDEEDCTSERILTKREYLESLMPDLKRLVLPTTSSV